MEDIWLDPAASITDQANHINHATLNSDSSIKITKFVSTIACSLHIASELTVSSSDGQHMPDDRRPPSWGVHGADPFGERQCRRSLRLLPNCFPFCIRLHIGLSSQYHHYIRRSFTSCLLSADHLWISSQIGRSKLNGGAARSGLVFRVDAPLHGFGRPWFSVQMNSGIEF